MSLVQVIDVDRPSLDQALLARGLRRCGPAEVPTVALIRHVDGGRVPAIVEAADHHAAARLLDCGAHDIVLAGDPDALVAARLAALARRAMPVIRLGGLAIDTIGRRVEREGVALSLRPREYELLLFLARRVGSTVSRGELLREVCGIGFDPGTNIIQVHMSRLRAALHRGFTTPILITEKRGGYRLEPDGTASLSPDRAFL